MDKMLLISDAAKEVKVESHVLRYWEDELKLPIKRNELGHRYYTDEDVKRFKQIKIMKDQGLQLKAIKMILRDGKLDVVSCEDQSPAGLYSEVKAVIKDDMKAEEKKEKEEHRMAITVISDDEEERNVPMDPAVQKEVSVVAENSSEKAKRLQWLLQQLIRETLQENNRELSREIREGIIKEMDYQFRSQEEREEERERKQKERSEEYYKKMDEILRMKTIPRSLVEKKEKNKMRWSKEKENFMSKPEEEKSEETDVKSEDKKEEHKMIDMKGHKKQKRHKKFFL